MRFFAGIWNLYLGVLLLLGNTVLVLIGLALSAYATMLQMDPLHEVGKDVLLFGGGILLVASSIIRRMVWSFCGLAIIWCGLIWAFLQVFADHNRGIDISLELIAVAVIPPFFMTLYLEGLHRNTSDLEISLSAKSESEE